MSSDNGTRENLGAKSPTIFNVSLSLADTEFMQTLPDNTRAFSIKPRQMDRTIQLAYISGESSTKFITVPPGGFWKDILALASKTIFIQSSIAGTVAEIEAWS